MKRTILAALAALILAAPAFALEALPTSNKPRSQRVAWVFDDGILAYGGATAAGNERNKVMAAGGLKQRLEQQGAQVDCFNSSWFLKSTNLTNSEATLWKNLGDTYALVIVDGAIANGIKAAGATNTTRFYRADSTNAQLLLLFGGDFDAAAGRDSSYSFTNTSSWAGGASQPYAGTGEVSYGARMAYTLYDDDNADTLWINYSGNGVNPVSYASGIASVVRILQPIALTAGLHPFPLGNDSTITVMPTAGDSTASSTAGALEILGPAWRTYFDTGAWVDNFLCLGAGEQFQRNLAMIPYAMAARYLTLEPILVSAELDDVFDMNPSHTGTRWSNDGYDSLMTTFAAFGMRPAISVNPLHGYEYMRGDDPTWEVAWSGDAWTWPRKWRMPWVHHSHDSSAARPTSNLIGRWGGYQNGNGTTDIIGTRTVYRYHRAAGFRWNPGGTFHERRYGIYNKLVYSDSLRRIVCPECIVPPYLSFPNNEVIPVNWRTRTVASNWPAYRSDGADTLCTVDSTFLAMARGLRVPSGGTLYLRGLLINGPGTNAAFAFRGWGDRSVLNTYAGIEGKLFAADSVIAQTPFLYPGEEMVIRDDAGVTDPTGSGEPYWVRVKNIACIPFDSNTYNYQSAKAASSIQLSRLLGFWTGILDGGGFTDTDGTRDYLRSTYTSDPTGVRVLNSNDQRGWTADRPRVIYFHPGNWTGDTGDYPSGPGESWQTYMFVTGILRPVRLLNTLAGYPIVKWVYPWETYSR